MTSAPTFTTTPQTCGVCYRAIPARVMAYTVERPVLVPFSDPPEDVTQTFVVCSQPCRDTMTERALQPLLCVECGGTIDRQGLCDCVTL